MARANPFVIVVERVGEPDIAEAPAAATGTIYPGYLVKWDSSAGSLTACNQDNIKELKVAIENPYSDENNLAAINTPYAAGDTVRFIYARPGDLLYMVLDDASTDPVSFMSYAYSYGATGDAGKLACNAGGTYPPAAGTYFFGLAETEKVAGSGAGTRVRVRVY